MNPYLEQEAVWQDFHDSFIPAVRDAISSQVSPHFIVKIEEHLYIHEPSAAQRIRVGNADVGVMAPRKGRSSNQGCAAVLQPPERTVIAELIDIEKQTYLEIRDRQNRDLVAVIELLSPTNKKPGPDREQYLAKRLNVLRTWAHFVEIDLLRGWERMPHQEQKHCDYAILVSRYEERPDAGFWPIQLRDPLPLIPIPLRPPLVEATLDLQALLHTVYDRAYYRDYIYQGVPTPPLTEADQAWADALIRNEQGA